MIEALSKPPIIKFTPGAPYTLDDLKVDLFGKQIIEAFEERRRIEDENSKQEKIYNSDIDVIHNCNSNT